MAGIPSVEITRPQSQEKPQIAAVAVNCQYALRLLEALGSDVRMNYYHDAFKDRA
jgi:hypothetical protein